MRGWRLLLALGLAAPAYADNFVKPKDDELCRGGQRDFSLADQFPATKDQLNSDDCFSFMGSAARAAALKRWDGRVYDPSETDALYSYLLKASDSELQERLDQVYDQATDQHKVAQVKLFDGGNMWGVGALLDGGDKIYRANASDIEDADEANNKLTDYFLNHIEDIKSLREFRQIVLARQRALRKTSQFESVDAKAFGSLIYVPPPESRSAGFDFATVLGMPLVVAGVQSFVNFQRAHGDAPLWSRDFIEAQKDEFFSGKHTPALVAAAAEQDVGENDLVDLLTRDRENHQLLALRYPAAKDLAAAVRARCDQASKPIQTAILQYLCRGIPVMAGISMHKMQVSEGKVGARGQQTWIEYEHPGDHGMVIQGIETSNGVPYFVFRNSSRKFPLARIPVSEGCRIESFGVITNAKDDLPKVDGHIKPSPKLPPPDPDPLDAVGH